MPLVSRPKVARKLNWKPMSTMSRGATTSMASAESQSVRVPRAWRPVAWASRAAPDIQVARMIEGAKPHMAAKKVAREPARMQRMAIGTPTARPTATVRLTSRVVCIPLAART